MRQLYVDLKVYLSNPKIIFFYLLDKLGCTLKLRSIYALFFVFNLSLKAHSESCKEWFDKLKIKTSKSCISLCQTSMVDMSTFSCHNECESFCRKTIKSCDLDASILKTDQLPKNWPWSKDKTFSLDAKNLEKLKEALKKENPNLLKSINGIFFIEKPKDLFSLGTETSYYEGQIIIYRRALENADSLPRKITHELGYHLHETIEKDLFKIYKNFSKIKNRAYLTEDSKFSDEEDFATNFEFYVHQREQLEKEIPKIYQWFKNHLNDKYKPRECL